jgi:cardiolipin synthase
VAAVVIARDLLILSVVLACRIAGVRLKMQPLMSSKINTTVQLLYIGTVLACKLPVMHVPYPAESLGMIVIVSTVFSGADYARSYYRIKDEVFRR